MAPDTQNGTETNERAVRRVVVESSSGLHARPASVLAARAREFSSEISLILVEAGGARSIEAGTRVDAKSVLDVIVLGAAQGTTLDVEAVGPDAQAAADALAKLFAERFGM